jgi:hypothetical protein
MSRPVSPARRGRSLAVALSLAAALGASACGGRGQVPAAEYDPDVPAKDAPPPPAPAAATPAAPAAPGAAPAAVLTPEQDSIQEERAFAHRKESMETYESCMRKANSVQEEPAHSTLRAVCARNREGGGARP